MRLVSIYALPTSSTERKEMSSSRPLYHLQKQAWDLDLWLRSDHVVLAIDLREKAPRVYRQSLQGTVQPTDYYLTQRRGSWTAFDVRKCRKVSPEFTSPRQVLLFLAEEKVRDILYIGLEEAA